MKTSLIILTFFTTASLLYGAPTAGQTIPNPIAPVPKGPTIPPGLNRQSPPNTLPTGNNDNNNQVNSSYSTNTNPSNPNVKNGVNNAGGGNNAGNNNFNPGVNGFATPLNPNRPIIVTNFNIQNGNSVSPGNFPGNVNDTQYKQAPMMTNSFPHPINPFPKPWATNSSPFPSNNPHLQPWMTNSLRIPNASTQIQSWATNQPSIRH